MGTAVITGAGRGLGRAIAIRLAADGHQVVAVDLDGETAESTAAEVGGEARQCDVSDWVSIDALAESIDSCDVLVNNAGIWHYDSILESTHGARLTIDLVRSACGGDPANPRTS